MKTRVVSLFVGAALAIAVAGPVTADTGGGTETDLGLDAVAISGATVDTKTGIATVTGTITCSADVEGFVGVDVRQNVGRFFTVRGWGGDWFSCAAAAGSATFSLSVQPEQGKFGGGAATAFGYAQADVCYQIGEDEYCDSDFADTGLVSIRLRGHG